MTISAEVICTYAPEREVLSLVFVFGKICLFRLSNQLLISYCIERSIGLVCE